MAPPAKLRIGDWVVDPAAGLLTRGDEVVRVDARTLRLLLELAAHPGQTVSLDQLLDRVWAGVIVTPDSVYQAVAALRRLLGDDPKRPRYIATVPRLGYRMVADVAPLDETRRTGAGRARRAPPRWVLACIVAVLALSLGLVAGAQLYVRAHAKAPVAVMPFLDLTDSMGEIELSDELTEGVIDRLAKNPRLKTPGFRDAILLRGRHLTPRQAAHLLGVDYVVDGALHSSPKGMRVTARLVQADSGFVIWSQTYEGPRSEAPRVEAAMASGIAGALNR
jgi:DNA-binding winged helix-turn-helix (wHTH) protein/TolB-like protein